MGISYPNLLKEWDYEKNGKVDPFLISKFSKKLYYWHCKKCGKKWLTKICNRTKGNLNKCICHVSLSVTHPDLAKQFHPIKNGKLTPLNIRAWSRKNIWWKCQKCQYEWETTIMKRCQGYNGCLKCRSLGKNNHKVINLWHPTKNKNLTPYDILPSSKGYIWLQHKLKCGEIHEWKAMASSINKALLLKNNGCPYCRGIKVCKSNSLLHKFPKIAMEWHPSKNGGLAPDKITFGSNKIVWWQCKKEHEWLAQVTKRTYNKNGCPKCSKQHRVLLKDGTRCDSKTEAFFYLKYKNEKLKFLHGEKYGGLGKRGWCKYDFYFPETNTYVEITGGILKSDKRKNWSGYHKRIERKKIYVQEVLGANFEFINHILTPKEKNYVNKNIK